MDLNQIDWQAKMQSDPNAIIIDVRTPDECLMGIIPNAITIDIYMGQDFINEIEKLDKSKAYYVYCRSGARSAQACAVMNQLGFANAFNLIGGVTEWTGELV